MFSFYDIDMLDTVGFEYIDEITVTASDGSSTFNPSSVTLVGSSPSFVFDGSNTMTGTSNNDQSGPGPTMARPSSSSTR